MLTLYLLLVYGSRYRRAVRNSLGLAPGSGLMLTPGLTPRLTTASPPDSCVPDSELRLAH